MEPKKEDRIVESLSLKRAVAKLPERQNFSTGFPKLNKMIVGLREGDLWIISGYPGTGKSQYMVSLARLTEELHPLFFSYEMPILELLERFGDNITSFYLPLTNTSGAPAWIEKKIQEAKIKYNTKIVFIDHLHYLVDSASTHNRNLSEIVGALVRELKQVAKRNGVAIILACHVRKATPNKRERPTMQDLKDSSSIGAEADVVLILDRIGARRTKAEEDVLISNDAWLYIDKCRHFRGQLGKIRMTFSEEGFYEEVEENLES